MRTTFLLLLLFASTTPSHTVKHTNKEYDFVWGATFEKLPRDPKITIDTRGGGLGLVYFGEVPADMELQTIGPDILSKLRTGQFAIEGTIAYYKLLPGSFLEMWCYFAPEKPGGPEIGYVTRTLDTDDPMSKVAGWEQDKHFQLPFDTNGAKTQLKRVVLKVHLTGGYDTHVVLNNVKLVEHPKGSLPVTIPSLSNLSPDLPLPVAPDPSTIGTLARKGQIIGIIPFDGRYASTTDLHSGRLTTSLLGGAPIANAGYSTLVFQYEGKGPAQIPLFTLSGDPLRTQNGSVVGNITSPYYAIVGQIKYENVSERSYLEMWSHFGSIAPGLPGGEYFSRGLQGFGPLGEITGTSDWREFWQPFDSTGSNAKLTSLDFNLHLTGPGTVSLRWLKLVQFTRPVWIENDAAAMANVSQVVIDVSYANGAVSYRVDNQPCADQGDLLVRLQDHHKSDPNVVAVIHADKTLPHNEVLFVVATVRDAGIQRVTFDLVSPAQSPSLSWWNVTEILFSLGILLLLSVVALLIFLYWRGKKRRHERELRRIASLDS